MLVSIIIPLFNKADHITKCLDSILTQSFTDFELIVINDGSTDNGGKLVKVKSIADSRIRYFEQKNRGVSNARNRGIKLSQGEYMLFIDADDYISTEYLTNIVTNIKYGDDIIITGLTKVYSNNTLCYVNIPQKGCFTKEEVFINFAYNQKINGIYGYISNKLIKTEIVKSGKIMFDESVKMLEDYDFFIKYYPLCKQFKFIDETGYFYTQAPDHNSAIYKDPDYIKLAEIHKKAETMLEKFDCLNQQNREVLYSLYSNYKIAYFTEMKTLNKLNILTGIDKLSHIKFRNISSINDLIIKKLVTEQYITALLIHLKIRLLYIKIYLKINCI